MSSGHQRIKWRRNIAEIFNRLTRVHERYRQTDRQTIDRRQTDGRTTTYREHEHEFTFANKIVKFTEYSIFVQVLGEYSSNRLAQPVVPKSDCCKTANVKHQVHFYSKARDREKFWDRFSPPRKRETGRWRATAKTPAI